MSTLSFHQRSNETPQETLLRTTLCEHTPQTVDLEHAWARTSPRLGSLHEQATLPREDPFSLKNRDWQSQGKKRGLKRWQILTAAAALLLALLGAGLFGPLTGGIGGSQPAYAQVNQARQSQGITFKVIQAYASASVTSFVFEVNLPPALAKDNLVVVPWKTTLVSQQEHMASTAHAVGPDHDLVAFPAIHPPANAQNVTLTWNVSTLELVRGRGQVAFFHGNWTMHFTIPFHHNQQFPPALPGKYWIISGDRQIVLHIAQQLNK